MRHHKNYMRKAGLAGLCAAILLFSGCAEDAEGDGDKDKDTGIVAGEIVSFTIDGYEGIIDGDTFPKTITVVLPQYAPLAALAPEIIVSGGATVSPASGVARDFSASAETPLTYTVSGGKAYQVTVQNAGPGRSERAITAFTITVGNNDYEGTINETAKTVTLTLPYNTPQSALSALSPTIEVSADATVDPASGAARDFRASAVSPLAYTVTAENGMKARYRVTVQLGGRGSADNPLAVSLSLSPNSVTLSDSNLSATIMASAGFDTYAWFVDGSALRSGTERSITVHREGYIIGSHTLGVIAYRDGVPFSAEMTFVREK